MREYRKILVEILVIEKPLALPLTSGNAINAQVLGL